MQFSTFKRGSTFGAQGTYTAGTGAPATLAGSEVTSMLKDNRGNRHTLTVTIAPNNLDFSLSYLDTTNWGVGMAVIDLRIKWSASQIQYTQTDYVNVIEEVTTA
jgi:hypothetical protein